MEQMDDYVEMNGSRAASQGEQCRVVTQVFQFKHAAERARSAKAFRECTRRIDDTTIFVCRAVKTLSGQEGTAIHSDAIGLLESISREEENVFSQVPENVKETLKRRKALLKPSKVAIKGRESRLTEVFSDRTPCRDYGAFTRFTIDPNVPLLTLDELLSSSKDLKMKQTNGHYHELFFGNRDAVVFSPPLNNKRRELEKREEEKLYWKKKMLRPAREYKVNPVKVLKVSGDFVPSCAEVDHSTEQEKLRERKTVDSENKNPILFK
uniref:Uncharacterized protein n=1 Tax=Trypanosoma congolense (strain IL3000) TaxID=1068625 RepID=G0UZ71_TRYCI|nr:conserved hypothetical protein [Trypanosoma congolense IL3000]